MNLKQWMILFILVLLPAVLAQEDFEAQFTKLQTQSIGQTLTGQAGKYFGDEIINLHLSGIQSSDIIIGLKIENAKIITLDTTELQDADVDIYLSDETLFTLLGSQAQLTELGTALNTNKITYTAHGLFNKIKYSILVSAIKRKTQG